MINFLHAGSRAMAQVGVVLIEGPDPFETYVVSATDPMFMTATVPIPAAAWLLGSGLAGLAGLRRRSS